MPWLFLAPSQSVERGHTCLRPIRASKPDWPTAQKVAHDDAVGVSLADRNLVDADHLGRRRAGANQLRGHVLLFELFDCVPIKVELLGNILDRRLSAAAADKVGEPLGKMRVVRQEIEQLAFHFTARPAGNASHLEFEIDPRVPAGKIACATGRAVIPAAMLGSASATQRFFDRRLSLMMRALKSPNTPRTVPAGRKPGNLYASCSRRFRLGAAIQRPRPISSTTHTLETLQRRAFLMC